MHSGHRKSLLLGFTAGIGLTSLVGVLMGQGVGQPVRSDPQYFVTADGQGAHLWVGEAASLRVVGHGECKECAAKGHDHHDDTQEHDHGKQGPRK